MRMFSTLIQILAVDGSAPAASSVLERLDPPKRAAVVMALLGLMLTGLVLVTCVMLGSHWVRRLARHRPRSRGQRTTSRSPAESRRVRKSLEGILPSVKSGDTVQLDPGSSETIVDPRDQ
jgi:hypothetical protein